MEPRLAGITFLRNAVRLGYPFVESIRSILPVVDDFVVAVGTSDDGTLDAVRAIDDPKIRVVPTEWNTSVPNGFVYAQQTMLALFQTRARWVLSIQGDEVVHEDDLPSMQASIERADRDDRVEALTFDYLHFYGRPDILGTGSRWYRREVRLLRNSKRFVVPSDAQCYTIIDRNRRMRYPNARPSGARMFHYGWLRPTEAHLAKAIDVSPMWGGKVVPAKPYAQVDRTALATFTGTHPAVAQHWLKTMANQDFAPDPQYTLTSRDRRLRVKDWFERALHMDFSIKHFHMLSERA